MSGPISKTVILSFVVGIAMSSHVASGQQAVQTQLGVFDPLSPQSVTALGATAVRLVVTSTSLQNGMSQQHAVRLKNFKDAGFTVILTHTVHENRQTATPLPANGSAEWNSLIENFAQFLILAGASIDYCALDNEPQVALVLTDLIDQGPAVALYTQMAKRAKLEIKNHPLELAKVKVASPALFHLSRPGVPGFAIFKMAISNADIDVIDLHAHVASAAEIDTELTFIRNQTNKPLTVSEWSQAEVAKVWLSQPLDPAFAANRNLNGTLTNRAFIDICYHMNISKVIWDEFVATAPYAPEFINNAFVFMVKHDVSVATYGSQRQNGNNVFDAKQLLCDRTVEKSANGSFQENYKFPSWYRDLAKSYNAGQLKSIP